MTNLGVNLVPFSQLLVGQFDRHESSDVLLVHEVEKSHRCNGLLFFQSQVRDQFLKWKSSFLVERLPNVPSFVQRIFGLMRSPVSRKYRMNEIWNRFVGLAKADSYLVVERSSPILFDESANLAANADVAVRVNDSRNVSVGGFHSVIIPNNNVGSIMSRVGKDAAGRLLDGRTWDEFPKVSVTNG